EIIVSAFLILVLLFSFLAFGKELGQQLIRYCESGNRIPNAADLLSRIEGSITRYLSTITFINLLLGIVISLGMYAIGLPNPLLWGAMAAILNFIPYIGVTLGTCIVIVV